MQVYWQKCAKLFFGGLLLFGAVLILINVFIIQSTKKAIYTDSNKVPSAQAVLVLGAKVESDGRLSGILEDRAVTALELYKAGKVTKVLVSGDHGTKNYDEVNALKKYLLANGVAPEDLFLDHAGFSTYDSLYRARDIFKANSLIITTQNFHLPRALYIGRGLGIDVVGFSADRHAYAGAVIRGTFRESLARIKAFLFINLHFKPKFLGPTVPLTGDSQASWD